MGSAGKRALAVIGAALIWLAATVGSGAPAAWADPAVQHSSGAGPGPSGTPVDYLLVFAGVMAWVTFTMWLAARHRRSVVAAFRRAATALSDEAERWLRDQ